MKKIHVFVLISVFAVIFSGGCKNAETHEPGKETAEEEKGLVVRTEGKKTVALDFREEEIFLGETEIGFYKEGAAFVNPEAVLTEFGWTAEEGNVFAKDGYSFSLWEDLYFNRFFDGDFVGAGQLTRKPVLKDNDYYIYADEIAVLAGLDKRWFPEERKLVLKEISWQTEFPEGEIILEGDRLRLEGTLIDSLNHHEEGVYPEYPSLRFFRDEEDWTRFSGMSLEEKTAGEESAYRIEAEGITLLPGGDTVEVRLEKGARIIFLQKTEFIPCYEKGKIEINARGPWEDMVLELPQDYLTEGRAPFDVRIQGVAETEGIFIKEEIFTDGVFFRETGETKAGTEAKGEGKYSFLYTGPLAEEGFYRFTVSDNQGERARFYFRISE